jgi:hypothetical protein
MKLAGLVARMEEVRHAYITLVGKPAWKRPLERGGVDAKIILEWMLLK